MNFHAHIDILGGTNYLVRVTSVTRDMGVDEKGREKLLRTINGDELIRFDHKSELRGSKLRAEVEAIAAGKVKSK